MRLILLLLLFFVGCASNPTYQSTKYRMQEVANDFCSHSPEHRDIIMLGISEMIEPNSILIICDCEYGMECQNAQ